MPPRLGYKKSRQGCLRCKLRRVKCDENQPCSACARHGVKCEYAEKPIDGNDAAKSASVASSDSASPMDIVSQNASRSPPTSLQLDQVQQLVQRSLTHAPSLAIPTWITESSNLASDQLQYFDKFITSPKSVERESWLTDLELIHHYTSYTYATLPRANEVRQMWQEEIPKLAMSHIFLLHQILAIAAHHQSYLHPDQYSNYTICASLHQNKAINGLRAALSQITEDTCHEVFVASAMLVINAFASVSRAAFSNDEEANNPPKLEDLLHVFQLTRGMIKIVNSYTNALHQGSMRGLLLQEGGGRHDPFVASIIERLQQLEIPDAIHPDERSTCQEAIEAVIRWAEYSMASTESPAVRISVSLAICLSEEFIELIWQHHPIALLVIAYCCVILHESGRDNWYLRGWGRSVVVNIMSILGQSWAVAMEWPLRMTEN